MAMTYQNFASLGVNLNRQKYGPLDISNVFTSAADLKYYLTKGTFTEGVSEYWYKNANEKIVPYPYEGQVLATVIDGVVSVYALSLDAEGNFQTQEIGAKVETDDKTIKLVDGKLELVGLPEVTTGKTFVPSLVNGVLTWAEPDTSTAEGQQQAIDGLTTRMTAVETVVNGKPETSEGAGDAVVGLVDKVAALEAVDNATQAELDAYKEVVTAAIAAGVKEAKDYADEKDDDTVYDDTALSNRVKAIEDDYLKTADKYDDTALAARVKAIEDDYLTESDKYDDSALQSRMETAEEDISGLKAAVEAIDYVDADGLASALQPYAKTSDVTTELAKKADKTDLEDLKATVDAFLTGTGTEAALDSLKELIAYIDEHDGADLTEMVATIERIEGKLEGIDSTVVTYVNSAIEALKIGDYAKASDLTALAERVSVLEAKPFDTYATKTELSNVDAKFANYTTTDNLTTLLAAKADADKVVSNETFATFQEDNTTAIGAAKDAAIAAAKTETESQISTFSATVASTYATKDSVVEAVEGIENDLLVYAKTEDVNKELAKKIETATISHSTDEKAEGATVTGTQLDIVVDAFTKAETRQYVADTIKTMTGGESAADVKLLLENHIAAYTEKVGQIDATDEAQDTAIAAAQAQADKGVADAATVATNLAALDVRVVNNANEINVVKGTITTVNETLSGKVTTLENKDIELAGLISGLDTAVKGHATTIGEHTAAITTLQTRDTEIAALVQANTDKFANYYTATQVDTKVKEVADAVGAIDLTPFAKTADVNAALDLKAAKTDLNNYYTKEEANTEFMTQDEVDARIDALIAASDPDGDGTVITNIQNLVEYVENNAGEITALVTATNENTAKLEGIETTVIDAIDAAIDAIVMPKASEEITIDEDGTLGLGAVNVNKLTQTEGDVLILDGGSATD